ncbi:MAG TPA: DsbA family protein [Methyloceanibacter sp.]|nr:DsbA family protein [Methyloceanibacter sp.]
MPRSSRLLVLIGLAGLFGLVVAYAVLGYLRSMRQEREIATHAEEIFRSPTSFVAGNPKGDVSVVAFLDYNCPYCRQDAPELARLIETDGKVRLVLKELPVLGKDSEEVARIALAAAAQGKYFELHQRLYAESGRATKAKALRIAGDLGLDVGRLERDMDDPTITAALLENTRLARDIGVRGVPFYLVGDRVLGEGNDLYAQLSQKVADIRENGCRAAC